MSKQITKAVDGMRKKLEDMYPGLPNSQWIAIRLLEGDNRIIEALRNNEFAHA
jgi:hypothetical protein